MSKIKSKEDWYREVRPLGFTTYASLSTTGTDQSTVGQETTTRAESVGLDIEHTEFVRVEIVLDIVGSLATGQLGGVVLGLVNDQHLGGSDQSDVLGSNTGETHSFEGALGQTGNRAWLAVVNVFVDGEAFAAAVETGGSVAAYATCKGRVATVAMLNRMTIV